MFWYDLDSLQNLLTAAGVILLLLVLYLVKFVSTKKSESERLLADIAQLEQLQQSTQLTLQEVEQQKAFLQDELSERNAYLHRLDLQHARLEERANTLEMVLEEKQQLQSDLIDRDQLLQQAKERIAVLETSYKAQQKSHHEKLQQLEDAREQLKQEFQNLANRIFDEKSERFSQKNQEALGNLISPFREQLGEFKRRVEDVYDKEAKDRRALYEQISSLKQLNQQMSQDAINLTNALKGESKVQGNWGEVILERALEQSGLRKGHEFELQVSVSEQERRYQPDAIIHLPDEKDIIVDAKVSLTAYEQYCSSEDETLKANLLREHLRSLNQHIKGLSDKAYHSLSAVRSLDFVLMFVPIEGAFLLALEKDPDLFKEAFNSNIMLVSPATLMVTLRTINNIWRYEHQNQNAQEIARRGGELHDKFVSFIDALDEVGKHLDRTQSAYEQAQKRLSTGRGNLVSQVVKLQKLGADSRKNLSSSLIAQAEEE